MKRVLLLVISVIILFLSASGEVYAKKSKEAVIVPPYWEEVRTGYIFTGDSRIRRLNLTIGMDELCDTWVVCKSGMGYSWFVKEGLEQISTIMEKEDYIDEWVIVSAWGVNDLWNIDTYISKYTQLIRTKWKKCTLYIMSVNPVNGRMTAKYRSIPYFNSSLKKFADKNEKKNVYYADTYSVMKKEGFATIDGLHYTERTNELIYETITDIMAKNYKVKYKSCPVSVPREYLDSLMSGNVFNRLIKFNNGYYSGYFRLLYQ